MSIIPPPPRSPKAERAFARLLDPAVAHRGLWTRDGAPENSLAAFRAAVEAGYGIELDVHLSADGEVMVFHDYTLVRMTGAEGKIAERTAADLAALRLKGTGESVPTLAQVLDLVDNRALIHVEIKSQPWETTALDPAVAALLDGYQGDVAVIGFNPQSHAWWAEHRPDYLRGLDSHAWADETALKMEPAQRALLQTLGHVAIAKPHFLALGLDMLPGDLATAHRLAGYPIVAWTVRTPEQATILAPHVDNIIFEGFAA